MSNPSHDDDWNDLARELGLEKSSPAPGPLDPIEGPDDPEAEPVGEERPAQGHGHEEPEVPYTGDDAGEEYDDAGGEPDAEGEGESGGEEGPPGEGQPGTGRKRRRRRRRRKKGGPAQPAEAGAEGSEGEPAVEEVVGYGRPTSADEEVLQEAASEDETEEFGTATDSSPADEDTTSDVLRELIATWNVPSWDEIVGGLHRPGG
jgi:hypothetical protein